MLPANTAIHFAQPIKRSLSVCVRHARLGMLGVLLILAFGCADDGGGPDPAPAAAAIQTAPVDLEPGQTSAVLAWEPSEGPVSTYYVLESRNESNFGFHYFTAEPQIEITGQPGDSVQIQVIALSDNGTFSSASPPSVPVRFHAAESTSSAATTETAASTSLVSITSLAAPLPEPSADVDADSPTTSTNEAGGDGIQTVDQVIRERLLGADVRFPFSTRSAEANQWLSARIDPEIGAGLSFVGTGDADGDDFRELIWTDSSGQLFVSDGARLTALADPASLLTDGPRLAATERFAGLADFRGDGQADWLIEDIATQIVWLVDEATQAATALGNDDSNPSDESTTDAATTGRLLGHGDFDGDGQWEFVWQGTDGSLGVMNGSGSAIAISWTPGTELGFDPEASELLVVADLDGDGRDDLLFRDTEDRLLSATSTSTDENGEPVFSPALWSAQSSDGLELIAALDFDGDGMAELAWHDGIDVALWSASDTF